MAEKYIEEDEYGNIAPIFEDENGNLWDDPSVLEMEDLDEEDMIEQDLEDEYPDKNTDDDELAF